MKRQYILLTLLMLMLANTVEAQRRDRLVFNDETATEYFSGGFVKDSVLTLYAVEGYDKLSDLEKQKTFGCFVEKFRNYQVNVQIGEKKKELWLPIDGNLSLVETWELKEASPEKVVQGAVPAETVRQQRRATRRFYYLGGQFSGSKGSHSGTLNGRFGAFLYNNKWDTSMTLNLGYVKDEEFHFTGSIGMETRTYFPIRKVKLAPYVGGGYSWTFAPSLYTEFRALTGVYWFVGRSGNLDAGIQYGLKSGFSFAVGYTFQPRPKAQ